MRVTLSTGESGAIEGSFGQSGKFKVSFQGLFYSMSIAAYNCPNEQNQGNIHCILFAYSELKYKH